MSKGKVVILPFILIAAVVIAACIAGVIVHFTCGTENEKEKSSFDYTTPDEVRADGYNLSVNNAFEITDREEFGYAGKTEVRVSGDRITSINFVFNLFEGEEIHAEEEEKKIKEFVSAYSAALQLPVVENPLLIQFADDETFEKRPEDPYVGLAEGDYLFEYSYRDMNGTLWIVRIYSPRDNMVTASVTKYLDDSDFEDFVPQINLQGDLEQ